MFRKQTRPKMFVMPRRDPTFQLSSRPLGVTPRASLRQQRQRPAPTPALNSEPVPVQPQRPASTPAAKSQSVNVLPRQVKISTYAREPFSILREILSDKTKDREPEKNYTAQIPVIVEPREIRRPKFETAFPGFKLHRLWKLQPGVYSLLGWDKPSREILLRHRNSVFRSCLPNGVMEPPGETMKTNLEIGRPEDGQRRWRVTVKWVSV